MSLEVAYQAGCEKGKDFVDLASPKRKARAARNPYAPPSLCASGWQVYFLANFSAAPASL